MLEKKRKIIVGVGSKYINRITRIKSTEYLVERKNTYKVSSYQRRQVCVCDTATTSSKSISTGSLWISGSGLTLWEDAI